jgi:hypothetical protein
VRQNVLIATTILSRKQGRVHQQTNACAIPDFMAVASVLLAVQVISRVRLVVHHVRCVVTTNGVISVRQNVLIATTILSR